ncbi:hypothetical protein ACWOBE_05425 [Hutsoniella sourekii]
MTRYKFKFLFRLPMLMAACLVATSLVAEPNSGVLAEESASISSEAQLSSADQSLIDLEALAQVANYPELILQMDSQRLALDLSPSDYVASYYCVQEDGLVAETEELPSLPEQNDFFQAIKQVKNAYIDLYEKDGQAYAVLVQPAFAIDLDTFYLDKDQMTSYQFAKQSAKKLERELEANGWTRVPIEIIRQVEDQIAASNLEAETAESAYQEPAYSEPSYQEPVYPEPSYQEPVYEEPAYTEPTYVDPGYTEPVTPEPAPAPLPAHQSEPDKKIYHSMGKKPILYFYPEEETEVHAQLDIKPEKFVATYPAYPSDGWRVVAQPDGTLTDPKTQLEYSYLFWEADLDADYDLSKGYVVKGEDTAQFLQTTLSKMGLTPREYNEFIVYWLPLMQDNPYNLITFQDEAYTQAAPLKVTPEPDSLLRVFMVYQALEEPIEVEEPEIKPFERQGFTVVEWGGSEIPRD